MTRSPHPPATDWWPVTSSDTDTLVDHAATVRRSFLGDRAALADIASDCVSAQGGGPASRTAAARLGDPATVVACGQQPAYGAGPAFNLIKIAQAISLARRLEAAGQPAVPVYWSAGEDHDQGEADHCDLLDRRGRPSRLRLGFQRPGASLRHQPMGEAGQAVLAALAEGDGPRLGADWLTGTVARLPDDLAGWCTHLLQELWNDSGLVVLPAHRLRPLWRQRWSVIIADWPATALAERVDALAQAGLPTGLGELAEPPVFADWPVGRRPLTPTEASTLLAEDPDRLSPGAGLRPLLQQLALPVVAYCAGPGEVAYHRQLAPLYDHFTVTPPALLRRWRLRWLPGWWRRAVSAWGLEPTDFDDPGHIPDSPTQADPALADSLQTLELAINRLPDASNIADDRRRLSTGSRRLQNELQRLRRNLTNGRRRRAGHRPLGELHAWLHPRGRPQERVLSTIQLLYHLGPGLTRSLLNDGNQELVSERPVD